jgi:tRNA(Ile)-lysidine synthase
VVNWAFDHGVSAHGAPCDRVPVTVAASEVRRAVRDALAALPDAARRVPLVVGCSGGADSLALTIAAAAVRGLDDVRAVVVDHRLQDGSAERAAATVALLAERGIAARVHAVDVTGPGGIEAAARRARQAALCAARPHPDSPILLGHTLDDQAETVLLGLGRGSGARSLAGMRRWDPPFLRPLLTVRRATTRAACTGFAVWDDPHNADPRFTRVRLRHEVLPLLEDVLSGGVAEALARTADQLREDADALDALAAHLLAAACAPAAPSPTAPSPAARCPATTSPATTSPATTGPSTTGPSTIGPSARGPSARGPAAPSPAASSPPAPSPTPAPAAPELDLAVLADVPPALRRRVLRAWLAAAGVTGLTATHLHAADALAARGPDRAGVAVPGGLELFRASGRLGIRPVRWPSAR